MLFSKEDLAFRDEVRDFITENLPPDIRKKGEMGSELAKDDYMRWHKILYGKGWVAPNWPKKFGGAEWTPVQRYLFDEEAGLAAAPPLPGFGLAMVGPVLMGFGTKQQQERYLPRILSGEDFWCQGYSEPGSGSDLASLQTRAERDGDDYVINGSKLWTSQAHFANMMFCLVRTSIEPKRQQGISFLIFSIDRPGIDIQPVITLDGLRHVNQVFFENLRVPGDSLVGEEGQGWTIAKYLLGHERMSGGAVGALKRSLAQIKMIAGDQQSDGRPLIEDDAFRTRLAQTEIELMAVEHTVLRALAAVTADRELGTIASRIKIRRSEVRQALTELAVEAAGYYAQPYLLSALKDGWNEEPVGPEYANPLTPDYMFLRADSIYSGSNEIQRNIIAKHELEL